MQSTGLSHEPDSSSRPHDSASWETGEFAFHSMANVTVSDLPSSVERPRVRWWLAGLLTVGGLIIIALGYLLSIGLPFPDEVAANYWSSVAINIGTTLLLAAALVLLERELVVTARREVQRATAPIRAEAAAARAESESVRAQNAQLGERTALLESRLIELDAQLRARADAVATEQARAFTILGEVVDRDTVIQIMEAAARINALGQHSRTGHSGSVTVPAGTGLEAPRITLEYALIDEEDWSMSDVPSLALWVVGIEDEPTIWTEGESAVEVFSAIRELMIRRGEARRTGPLSAEAFFRNLSASVEQATLSRSGHANGWLQNTPLLEMVTDGWMITNGGVEVEGHGLVIPRDLYPHDVPGAQRTSYRVGAAPSGLDGPTWDFAAERGIHYFTSWNQDPWNTPF